MYVYIYLYIYIYIPLFKSHLSFPKHTAIEGTSFVPALVAQNQPAMWSEDEQWFDRFSQGAAVRHTGDVGRGVAKFIAVGGSMHNFYMFHGGTMWGNWSTTIRRTRLTPSYA